MSLSSSGTAEATHSPRHAVVDLKARAAPVVIAHDETRISFLDPPWRRETARGHEPTIIVSAKRPKALLPELHAAGVEYNLKSRARESFSDQFVV
jgi:hypothetical protein